MRTLIARAGALVVLLAVGSGCGDRIGDPDAASVAASPHPSASSVSVSGTRRLTVDEYDATARRSLLRAVARLRDAAGGDNAMRAPASSHRLESAFCLPLCARQSPGRSKFHRRTGSPQCPHERA